MRLHLAALLLLVTAPAFAEPPTTGPFGFTQGMTLAQLKKVGPITSSAMPLVYRTTVAPKPHPGFEGYSLVVSPTNGLCKVLAVGKDIQTNGFGIDVRSAFERLETALTERYGSSSKFDELLPGSIWKDANDWTIGLAKKERFLMAAWNRKYGSTLPPGVDTIALEAKGMSNGKAYLQLAVEFENFDKCQAEMAAEENSAL